jgi:hypothetical protein
VAADLLETIKHWLALKNFDNAKWIGQKWIEMFLEHYADQVWEMTNKVRQLD